MNYSVSNDSPIVRKIRWANLKITPQRVAVLSEINDDFNHPSAEVIYRKVRKKMPHISFDTVNRTLLVLAKRGVIGVAEGRSGSRRYDPRTESHHHFYCLRCNKIIDFVNKEADRIKLPESIAQKHQILSWKIVLDGVCWDCKNKKDNKGRK